MVKKNLEVDENEIMLVDKPAGISSFGVVAKVRRKLSEEAGYVEIKGKDGIIRRKLKKVKVGHTGTLDPFATGLLILLIGKGTKRANEFLKLDKEYVAKIKLGEISDTGDIEGNITPYHSGNRFSQDTMSPRPVFASLRFSGVVSEKKASLSFPSPLTRFVTGEAHLRPPSWRSGDSFEKDYQIDKDDSSTDQIMKLTRRALRRGSSEISGEAGMISVPTREEVEEAVRKFVGEIEQRVPNYSAVKINGQRAYKLARDGKAVEMPVRKVKIYDIEILSYEWPYLEIKCSVSSGTYIRALGEDIGRELGVGGYLMELRRTKIDRYSIENAIPINL